MIVLLYFLALVTVAAAQTCQSVGMGPCDGAGGCRDPSLTCTSVGTPNESCCSRNEVIPDNLNPQATCRVFGFGPCTANKYCGPDATCTSIGTADETCCLTNDVVLIPPPFPTTTPAPMPPCVDLVNPANGISDCPRMASYCNNAAYFDLMTEQCPRTCNRCPGTPPTTPTPITCVDLVNPSTLVSDCPKMAGYCNNPVYYDLMTEQCPKTCNRCTGGTGVPTLPATCVDLVNPANGISDCPRMASYCNNSAYYDLMTEQCPRTCNRC